MDISILLYIQECCRLETATSSCVFFFIIDSATVTVTIRTRHKEDRVDLLVRLNRVIGSNRIESNRNFRRKICNYFPTNEIFSTSSCNSKDSYSDSISDTDTDTDSFMSLSCSESSFVMTVVILLGCGRSNSNALFFVESHSSMSMINSL